MQEKLEKWRKSIAVATGPEILFRDLVLLGEFHTEGFHKWVEIIFKKLFSFLCSHTFSRNVPLIAFFNSFVASI